MTQSEAVALPLGEQSPQPTVEELRVRVAQLEAEQAALEEEATGLKQQLEKLTAHRQTSHSELVIILTDLVSRLPLNDVAVIVARLVEHNTRVTQYLTALAKGTADVHMEAPSVLKSYDQTKRDLAAAIKPLVEELVALDPPFEKSLLLELIKDHEQFFAPKAVRAARCFFKGQVPRERIVREFGTQALPFFVDLTTDPKFNPRPKPEEIVLAFRNDFEAAVAADTHLSAEKRAALQALYRCVQENKCLTDKARAQKTAFLKLSFVVELLHYYEHQSTENPETAFAHRLPALIEQLVFTGPTDQFSEDLLKQAEDLVTHVVNPDHRQMILNNIGKSEMPGKTLKYVLKLRQEKVPELDQVIVDFVRHLLPAPPAKPPPAQTLSPIIKLILPSMQRYVLRSILTTDRMRRSDAEALAKTVAETLGVPLSEAAPKTSLTPEAERQTAWAKIKDMLVRREEPATIADAFRDRLHQKYDGEEIRQSWVTLTEIDPMSLIRVFCHLPYNREGKTDPIARPVMEAYVSRLMHEKYAATYRKVVRSLHNMYSAKPDSPTLQNFMALVRWVDPNSAARLGGDVGMAAH